MFRDTNLESVLVQENGTDSRQKRVSAPLDGFERNVIMIKWNYVISTGNFHLIRIYSTFIQISQKKGEIRKLKAWS